METDELIEQIKKVYEMLIKQALRETLPPDIDSSYWAIPIPKDRYNHLFSDRQMRKDTRQAIDELRTRRWKKKRRKNVK